MKKSLDYLSQGKKKHDEEKQKTAERQRAVFLQNKYAYSKQRIRDLSQKCANLEKELKEKQDFKEFLESEKVMEVSMQVDSLSPISYSLLANNLNFPPKSRIDAMLNEIKKQIPNLLTSISGIPQIIDNWKERSQISKSITIYGCLAVDAIYFTPQIEVNQDSIFEGLFFKKEDDMLISKKLFKKFYENPNDFLTFLSLNTNKIIKAGFVFQVQPFDVRYSNFIVHVEASINGKANDNICSLLFSIRDALKNRNITILTFAFDGDSGYSKLHNEFFYSYINSIIRNNVISFSKTIIFKVTSDFLHLIKRLRYRLFGVEIHSGFLLSNPSFNVDKLRQYFPNLPNIIWYDEPITKMHDVLPLKLFSIQNFLFLLEHKLFVEALYFMPMSLCILAFDAKNIGYSTRLYLLEIAFWFLVYYFDEKNNSEKIELTENKKNSKHIQFYSTKLLIEFVNTIYSNILLMHKIDGFCFRRNSTGPLENNLVAAENDRNLSIP